MRTNIERVKKAIENLRIHNHKIAAAILEDSIGEGTIKLKPMTSYTDQLIYAALIFENMDMTLELDPTYTFEVK